MFAPLKRAKRFLSVDSLNFVIKELSGQPTPGGEGTVTWEI